MCAKFWRESPAGSHRTKLRCARRPVLSSVSVSGLRPAVQSHPCPTVHMYCMQYVDLFARTSLLPTKFFWLNDTKSYTKDWFMRRNLSCVYNTSVHEAENRVPRAADKFLLCVHDDWTFKALFSRSSFRYFLQCLKPNTVHSRARPPSGECRSKC